jgi:hypothetical protein
MTNNNKQYKRRSKMTKKYKTILLGLALFLFCISSISYAQRGKIWVSYFDEIADYIDLSSEEWTDIGEINIQNTDSFIQLLATAEFRCSGLNKVKDKIRFDIRFVINGQHTTEWFGPYLTGYMDYTGIVINNQTAAHIYKSFGDNIVKVQARFLRVTGALASEYVRATKCSLIAFEIEEND